MNPISYIRNEQHCTIRQASQDDAKSLAFIWLQIDQETDYLDREPGEGTLDEHAFKQLIEHDLVIMNRIFLIAEVDGEIVGFARCEGSVLARKSHTVEFGVGILQAHWGLGLGSAILRYVLDWARTERLHKVTLSVIETNKKAIALYERYGFEVEGRLRDDKLIDGQHFDTILMGYLIPPVTIPENK
ncbi:GNAT family N-acetyltransferase [Exiguobacterium sp. 8H]|uniref:GNAT family N-acetyltransferase n=1 Tax=unclassified Exiguobacterium TaxID=2644629 RepID=UPI0012F0F1B2|nr:MULTISPECIES: GNAT family N-acetyltransferase [unclassified Exiguobacterium]VXC01648.1 GNAT family N-acetyltransferase [Exiguobacterium sp. 8H]VXC22156.1 GNAT family N-acetyltransferase [Exiguobacterium sp. 8A]